MSNKWEEFKRKHFSEKSNTDLKSTILKTSLSEIPYDKWESFLEICDEYKIFLIYLDLDNFSLCEVIYNYNLPLKMLRRFAYKYYLNQITNVFKSDKITYPIFSILCYDPLDFDYSLMMKFFQKKFISEQTFLAISLIHKYKLDIFSVTRRKEKPLKIEYKIVITVVNSKGFLTRKDTDLLGSRIFERIEVFDNNNKYVNMDYKDLSNKSIGWKIIGVL